MACIETWTKCDLKKPVKVEKIPGSMFSADNEANLIGVEIYDDGQPYSIAGSNVTGYLVREDGATVPIVGTASENKATILLPASAYVVVGQLSIVIKVSSTTVAAMVANIYRSTTDTLVDPGHVIPSIDELLEKIADCEAATAAATTAAGNANTAAGTANTAATNANSAAGTANTAAAKIDNMTADAESLHSGSSASATVTEVSGHKHIHFGIPRGADGRDGIIADIGLGLFAANIDSNGDLIITYNSEPPALSINSSGDLIYTIS